MTAHGGRREELELVTRGMKKWRKEMVSLIRRGHSQRSVARRFRVSLHTIQRWVQRAGVLPLHQVDWGSRSKAAHQVANKTSAGLEQEVCLVRKQLETTAALGFVGAQAIQDALRERAGLSALPSVRTIGRILRRRGLLDGQRRVRRVAPPPGWYLPEVAQQLAELDSFDVVVPRSASLCPIRQRCALSRGT
jgi:transposase